jgi:hypothetical protein
MNRTISPDVRDMLREIQAMKLVGEPEGPALTFSAGTTQGIFIVGDW